MIRDPCISIVPLWHHHSWLELGLKDCVLNGWTSKASLALLTVLWLMDCLRVIHATSMSHSCYEVRLRFTWLAVPLHMPFISLVICQEETILYTWRSVLEKYKELTMHKNKQQAIYMNKWGHQRLAMSVLGRAPCRAIYDCLLQLSSQ